MRLALFRLVVGALVAVIAKPVFADSFKFEYSFASADVHLTGTFTGVQNGAFVENISDVTLALNDVTLPGTFFSAYSDGSQWLSGAFVSFDVLNNNFIFSDADLAGGDWNFLHLFYIIEGSVELGTWFESPETAGAYDAPGETGTWKLTNLSTPTSVPDAGMTAMMLLLALVGLRLMRRQTAA